MAVASSFASRMLFRAAISAGLVGSGSLFAGSLMGDSENYEKINGLPKEHREIGKIRKQHYNIHFAEYRDKNFYEEGLSVLMKGGVWLGLLTDNIHGTNSQYIYYIKKSNGRKIRLSPWKPKAKNKGIYQGWKLNLFIWRGKNQKMEKWYGYCYPGKDEYGEKCDDLPEGWEKKPIYIDE